MWAAHTISQFGTQITFLALPLLAIAEFGAGPIELALLGVVQFLPYVVVGLPAGVLIDRMRRRPVMIGADVARAVILLTVPLAWFLGALTMAQIYLVGFLAGMVSAFFDIASQSYLPTLIAPRRLVEGNSRLEASNAAARVAGPSVSGLLVQAIGAPVSIGIDALSYLASGGLLAVIRRSEPSPAANQHPGVDRGFWIDLIGGARFVWNDRRLRALASSSGIGNIAAGIFDAIYVLYLVSAIGLDAATVGLIYGIGNGGLLVAALVVRQLAERIDRRRLLIASAASRALGFSLAPLAMLAATVPLLAVGRALIAASVMVYNVEQVSLRQTITPAAVLGRTNATVRVFSWGTIPLGLLAGGVIASVIGLWATLWVGVAAGAMAMLPLLAIDMDEWHEAPPGADRTASRLG